MRKRKKDDSSGEGAYWMDTYGDMVTLLLTFFVLLFSFSTIDAAKWMELANALSGTPIVAVEALSATEVKAPAIEGQNTTREKPSPTQSATDDAHGGGNVGETKERFDQLYEEVKNYVEKNGLQDKLNVQMMENAILMTMNESALFDSGSAVLKQEAREILPVICGILNQYDALISKIRIEGHTDNVPIQNSQYKDNWELSSARSLSVLYFLLAQDMQPEKMSPTFLGEYHPIDDNGTEAGKARNRRVDFMVESILKDD